MFQLIQTGTFAKWRTSLADARSRYVIASRLDRLAHGQMGDVAAIGDSVSDLRIHFGPGFRIYFAREGSTIVILLCGGDKSTQARDISRAKALAQEWRDAHG